MVQKLLHSQGISQNFQGQFDLEGQGQGHQFSNLRYLDDQ